MSDDKMSGFAVEPEPRDAKAHLKAAKAYAKAQRPWYRKKRWILSAGFLVLVIAAAGSGTSTTPESGAEAQAQAQDVGSEREESEDTTGAVGEPLTNAGTTYEVTAVDTTSQIGDPEWGGAQADGEFVVVDLSLTNNKDETKTFMESSAKVVTSDGNAYETSDKTVLAFGDESLLLKDIQPDLTAKGKLAFDLPPSKLAGSKLVIADLWGSGEVEIDLGL